MIGQTIAHYKLVDKLGEGGMGIVYLAEDLHLDWLVAVKLLPTQRAADEERRKCFVQEAKAASALNHSNIITIYDIATADGVSYMAMEYVRGRTLLDVIAHGRPDYPRVPRLRRADCGRPGPRTRRRDYPSRPQAGQHHGHSRRRRRKGAGFRAGETHCWAGRQRRDPSEHRRAPLLR